MAVEIGARVLVLCDEPPVCRDPLREGEIIRVVATKPAKCGGLGLTVCRDSETARHFVHSSSVVILGESRPIAEMSAAEMVERYFKVEQAAIVICGNLPEYDALNKERRAIFEALPNTPSRTYKDLNAKLRFAVNFTSYDDSTCPFLTGFLETLGRDHGQVLERIDEEDDASLENVGSYEEYFELKGIPMPKRPSV